MTLPRVMAIVAVVAVAVLQAGCGRPDLAYLAERVLTLDELLPLVDRLAPAPSRARRKRHRPAASQA